MSRIGCVVACALACGTPRDTASREDAARTATRPAAPPPVDAAPPPPPVDATAAPVPAFANPELESQRWDDGHGVAVDEPHAARAARAACERGVAEECWEIGQCYATGDGTPSDPKQALTYSIRACKGGDWWACDAVRALDPPPPAAVVARLHGVGVRGLEASCAAGDGEACADRAQMLRLGESGETVDAARGAELARRAAELLAPDCDRGRVDRCARLAEVWWYELGDHERARAIVDRLVAIDDAACARGTAAACDDLAYRRSWPLADLPADPDGALAAYRRACELGWSDDCRNAADAEPSRSDGARWHVRGCALGDPLACGLANSDVTLGQIPDDGYRARERAIETRWCRSGDQRACEDLKQ